MKTYKTRIHNALYDDGLCFEIKYAAITADTKAEAMRMAAKAVDKFMRCVVEQTVDAGPDAIKGVQWLIGHEKL